MRSAIIVILALVVVGLRIWQRRRRGERRAMPRRFVHDAKSDVGLIASREIRQRMRGRIYRVGTLVMLLAVGAAIVIPVIYRGGPSVQRLGVVGTVTPLQAKAISEAAKSVGTDLKLVTESDLATAERALDDNKVDVLVVNGTRVIVATTISSSNTSTGAQFAQGVASALGEVNTMVAAGLSETQMSEVAHATAVPITSLHPSKGRHTSASATSIVGVILLFVMLSQYNTWILIGVMEEKSSRVVEVLLAAVRPIQLLAGKVLGIGVVALAQAGLVVGFALLLAKLTGSSLLHGTAPLVMVSILFWLALGFTFYCWVYAAAGAMAERQDQVQTLALPLSVPLLVGYISSLTAATTGSASLFVKVLAYLPPTAPFAMSVLVGLGAVSWWQFAASALICVVSTFWVARLAATIYRRAILRTGGRVKLRDLRSQ